MAIMGTSTGIVSSSIPMWLQAMGYKYLTVTQFPQDSPLDNSCKYTVHCSKCDMTYCFKIAYYEHNGSHSQLIELITQHLKSFGDQHLHNSSEGIIGLEALKVHAHKVSNNHLDLEVIKNLNNDACLRCKCNICGYTHYLSVTDKSPQDLLNPVEVIAQNHVHVENPYISKPIQFYTYQPVQAPPYSAQPYQTYSIKQDLNLGPVTLSQELLKEIYKLSNFNVEPQIRRKAYTTHQECRAHCVNCGATVELIASEIGNVNSPTWDILRQFCEQHRHGGSVSYTTSVEFEVTERVGRKFKDL